MRKEWSQPRLVILGRGTPEENVLQICKNDEVDQGISIADRANTCQVKFDNGHPCRGVTAS